MSVNKCDRKLSKTEFDEAYFKLYDDCINLIELNFGAKGEIAEHHKAYIGVMADRILKVVCDMGTHIRIANSIYPKYKAEFETRRIHQDKALGLCFDLLTKYQLVMQKLRVKDDKFVEEIKHIRHEINCLKGWRESDFKRYKDLG